MAWIESHQALSRHRKTLTAVSLLKTDRHKLLGHLHELWWWALDNADTHGNVGDVPDEMIAEGAGWPVKDAERFVGALVAAGFLDRSEDGVVLHDWYDYAGKLNDQKELRRSSNRSAQSRRRQRLRQHDVSDDSQHDVSDVTADVADNQQSTVPNLTLPITPLPPNGEDEPAKKRVRRVGHEPITEVEQSNLVEKYAARFGGEPAVREEIVAALNHNARFKCLSERLYVDNWLRRELQHRPTRMISPAARNGQYHPPERPAPPREYIDVSGLDADFLHIKGRGTA